MGDWRLRLGGVIVTASGAILVMSLLLTWWGLPSAFDDPKALPSAAAFTAEAHSEAGARFEPDAFAFYDFRDYLWLATGLVGFAFGLAVLVLPSLTRKPLSILIAALGIAAAVLVAASLISPPDFGSLGPGDQEFDFGVDLPLSPEISGFVALASALGIVAGALLIHRAERPSRTSIT